MRSELKRLHLENDATTVYVTHDQIEAMSLADRIAIMNDGVLQQVGTPTDVYNHPANLFVAQFIGSPVMNISRATIAANGGRTKLMLGDGGEAFDFPADLPQKIEGASGSPSDLTVGVRPEGVIVSRSQAAGHVPVEAHIIEPLGAYDIVDLRVGQQLLRARTPSGFVAKAGDTVWARLDVGETHFFSTKTGQSLQVRLDGPH
jgi:multiple sugar transport system ATP-binding protein